MKKLIAAFVLALLAFPVLTNMPASAKTETPLAYTMQVQGAITPATADFIRRHLDHAARAHAAVAVIEIDTPGGLMDSTKDIIQAILASPVPVACYVSPAGAHAASAGTYILYACHIAAMAPGTNLGAATPVAIGQDAPKDKSTLENKAINDAAASIRSLADLRKRNAEWAEKAVREAVSISSNEALAQKVIDIHANSTAELIEKIDGRTVTVNDKPHTLQTKGAVIERKLADWRTTLLSIITNPNVSFLLMTLGVYGLIYEFANPGALFPGIVGGICLLLGLFAMNVLPVNYAGLALILLGLACMTAEAFVASFGILGIGGAISFAFGALILFDGSGMPGFGVSPWLIGALTFTSGGMLSLLLAIALKARNRPISTGLESMQGAIGEITTWSRAEGEVLLHGTIWKARSTLEYILKKGDKVKVVDIDGLCLVITPTTP